MKETSSELHNWKFSFKDSTVLAKSTSIDALTEQCKLFRSPTIIFDENGFIVEDKEGKLRMVYNVREALKFMNHEVRQKSYNPPDAEGEINTISYIPPKLYVQHAQHWKHLEKPKDIEITEVKELSDSFFLSPFKGYIEGKPKIEKVKEQVIPLEKLGPTNPITFYQQGTLYED